MTNKINICNQALANLGKAAIAALDNSSESARQCARPISRSRNPVRVSAVTSARATHSPWLMNWATNLVWVGASQRSDR